mmetsp:Transcript_14337/g.39058  ORF Transcript_14337/g.39058 Transcript_14337/m.39058 type:complete len:238 (-) Transcript_14337:2453-3166(-)
MSTGCCGIMLMLERNCWRSMDVVSLPSIRTLPPQGCTNRNKTVVSEDFPAPVRPTTPTRCPPRIWKERFVSASGSSCLYRKETSSNTIEPAEGHSSPDLSVGSSRKVVPGGQASSGTLSDFSSNRRSRDVKLWPHMTATLEAMPPKYGTKNTYANDSATPSGSGSPKPRRKMVEVNTKTHAMMYEINVLKLIMLVELNMYRFWMSVYRACLSMKKLRREPSSTRINETWDRTSARFV